jgi:ABC-type cobalamin/Fe3+-siderophores transport system ATPase subunit
VLLNSNLVAVIGPRSSGKSSLLAHIAHAIDPEETEQRQREVEPHRRDAELGPAPGVTWSEVADIGVEVNWAEPRTDHGRVIYVPQNALYAISQRRGEITKRIEPAVRGMDEQFDIAMRQMEGSVEAAREQIDLGVVDWFRVSQAISTAEEELLDRGDRIAVEATRDELGRMIAAKREASALEASDIEIYEKVMDELSEIEARLALIDADTRELRPHLERRGERLLALPAPSVEVRVTPNPSELPEGLRRSVLEITERAQEATVQQVSEALVEFQLGLDKERDELRGRDEELRKEHVELIKKNETNSEIEELTTAKRRQEELLGQIDADKERIKGLQQEKAEMGSRIEDSIAMREKAIDELLAVFQSRQRRRDPMVFGLEKKFDPDQLDEIQECFNRGTNGPLMDAGQPLPIEQCMANPNGCLEALNSEEQKLKRDYEPLDVARLVLGTSPKLLFWAEIEGDRIGGFETSSMSPGKQALFALSLILDDSDEPWPLLIDQPEDDLDSRSISTQLVGYLIDRKSERQIIMVSHDANLVIGADAEQVIVANRHGVNTKNADGRTFDYFSGSLEHTRERRQVELELECGGIREHACDILDGGEEAFRKRKRKYKIT